MFTTFNIHNQNYFQNKLNTNIDLANGKLAGYNEINATAFDLNFAFNKLFLSVILPEQKNSCASFNLMEIVLDKDLRSTSKKMIFSKPCMINENPLMWAGRIANLNKSLFLSVGKQRYDPSGFTKTDLLSKSEMTKRFSIWQSSRI